MRAIFFMCLMALNAFAQNLGRLSYNTNGLVGTIRLSRPSRTLFFNPVSRTVPTGLPILNLRLKHKRLFISTMAGFSMYHIKKPGVVDLNPTHDYRHGGDLVWDVWPSDDSNYAYMALGRSGLLKYNLKVKTPITPFAPHNFYQPSGLQVNPQSYTSLVHLQQAGNYLYAGSISGGGLYIFDITQADWPILRFVQDANILSGLAGLPTFNRGHIDEICPVGRSAVLTATNIPGSHAQYLNFFQINDSKISSDPLTLNQVYSLWFPNRIDALAYHDKTVWVSQGSDIEIYSQTPTGLTYKETYISPLFYSAGNLRINSIKVKRVSATETHFYVFYLDFSNLQHYIEVVRFNSIGNSQRIKTIPIGYGGFGDMEIDLPFAYTGDLNSASLKIIRLY